MLEEQTHDLPVTPHRPEMKRGVAVVVVVRRIRTSREEQGAGLVMSVKRGERQRGEAVLSFSLKVYRRRKELLD